MVFIWLLIWFYNVLYHKKTPNTIDSPNTLQVVVQAGEGSSREDAEGTVVIFGVGRWEGFGACLIESYVFRRWRYGLVDSPSSVEIHDYFSWQTIFES